MSENKVKWILVIAITLFLPLIFVAPMAGIFYIPLALIAIENFESWIMPLNFNPFTVIVLGQLVIYGFIIYLISKYAARRILKLQTIHSYAAVLVILLCLISITFLPVYGFEAGDNLYETYRNLSRI